MLKSYYNSIGEYGLVQGSEVHKEYVKLEEKYNENIDVGVGTLVNSIQLKHAKDIGVDFIVSPGLLPHLKDELQEAAIPFIPGVVTPTEVIQGMSFGYDTFKLFPAVISGGLKLLKR